MPRIEVSVNEIEKLIDQLKQPEKIRLVERLDRKTWGGRFRALTAVIDKRRRKYPVSQKELNQILKEVRQERYAASRT